MLFLLIFICDQLHLFNYFQLLNVSEYNIMMPVKSVIKIKYMRFLCHDAIKSKKFRIIVISGLIVLILNYILERAIVRRNSCFMFVLYHRY